MRNKFRKGAASFYIVAISTLILLIIATSFAAIIISEIERTSNDDLSQSAYDSALAGVEDSKVAFANYEQCKGTPEKEPAIGEPLDCGGVVYLVKHPDCYMVGRLLGRVGLGEESEVMVEESKSVTNNMQQAYTCVKMDPNPDDYQGILSSSNQIKVIRAKFDGVDADSIAKVKISWYSDVDGSDYTFGNFKSGQVAFPMVQEGKTATPPTIALAMVQTAANYSFADFDVSGNGTTDRGMIYMTPIGDAQEASKTKDTYIGAYNKELKLNHIGASAMVKSNDKTTSNLPYGVYCEEGAASAYACSATIELPRPVGDGAKRNNDTFMFMLYLPYGKPRTDFSLSFYCADGKECGKQDTPVADEGGDTIIADEDASRASLDGVQIAVDATGRANDLYRRVEVRLEEGGDAASFLALMGPLQLLGDGNDSGADLLRKNYPVTTEWNFSN